MSTDHHLEDNADDQRRQPHDLRRDVRELEDLQARALAAEQPTPASVRTRHLESAIAGSRAGQHLEAGRPLTDLVGHAPEASPLVDELDRRHQVVRVTGEAIPAGALLEVRADGRVYAVDETAGDLAAQLVDVAETAAASDQVDQAIADVVADIAPAPDYDFAEAIAGMANRHLQEAGLALEVVEACEGCGCTNRRACVLDNPRSIGGGMHVRTCHWINTPPGQPPRCSKCGPTDEALEENPATIMGIRIHVDDQVPVGAMDLRDRESGATILRVFNIEQPAGEDVTRLQQLLVPGDHHPIPYAARQTITAERPDDDETARRRS
jgi:hypothetical protein